VAGTAFRRPEAARGDRPRAGDARGILELLRELSQTRSMTMIIVTHQMRFAEECSDRVLFFDRGVILEEGLPKVIFHEPREARTREFLKSILEAGS
jgi:polar amino acid transport system ATP-binding protein